MDFRHCKSFTVAVLLDTSASLWLTFKPVAVTPLDWKDGSEIDRGTDRKAPVTPALKWLTSPPYISQRLIFTEARKDMQLFSEVFQKLHYFYLWPQLQVLGKSCASVDDALAPSSCMHSPQWIWGCKKNTAFEQLINLVTIVFEC